MNVEFCDLLKNSLLSQIVPYLRGIVSILIIVALVDMRLSSRPLFTRYSIDSEISWVLCRLFDVLVPYLRGIVSIRARLKHSRINSLSSIFLAKNWTKRLLANTSRPKFCQKENNHLSP